MSADAGAGVIVSDADDTDGGVSICRKSLEVEAGPGLFPGDEGFCDRQIGPDHVIDPSLDLSDLLVREGTIKTVVTFGFLFLDMGTQGPTAVEHPGHGTVQDVFGGVHSGVRFFFHSRHLLAGSLDRRVAQ